MRSRLFAAPLAIAALTECACGSNNAASKVAQPPTYEPAGQTKCAVKQSQSEPLIVEWPPAARGKLESQTRRGMVVVRYAGCEMQVLDRCHAKPKYGYFGITRKFDHVRIQNADELYASVPAGAARLEAKLHSAGELNVKMVIVGRYESDTTSVSKSDLEGECDDATHIVSAITVGAFDFFAGADAALSSGASFAGAGGGGASTAKKEMLTEDGNEAACEKSTTADKTPPDGCGALLRLEVVPLGVARAADPTCASGTKWNGKQCAAIASVAATSGTPEAAAQKCVAGTFEAGSGCKTTGALSEDAAMPQWATRDLELRYQANKGLTDSSTVKELIEISIALARRKQAERTQWYGRALEHWRVLANDKSVDAQKTSAVGFAAEADYMLVDAEIAQRLAFAGCPSSSTGDLFGRFDGQGQPTTTGKWPQIATDASRIDDKLEKITRAYASPLWITIATMRRGLLYEGMNTALRACTIGKGFDLFTRPQQALLKKLEESGRQDLVDKSYEIQDQVRDMFVKKRDAEAAGTQTIAFRQLARGILLANAYGASHAEIDAGRTRFGALHKLAGDDKMKEALARQVDWTDPDRKRAIVDVAGGLP